MQYFKINDTKGPNIAFICILCSFEDLWRHIQRAPYTGFEHLFSVFNVFSKTKIAEFVLTIAN